MKDEGKCLEFFRSVVCLFLNHRVDLFDVFCHVLRFCKRECHCAVRVVSQAGQLHHSVTLLLQLRSFIGKGECRNYSFSLESAGKLTNFT